MTINLVVFMKVKDNLSSVMDECSIETQDLQIFVSVLGVVDHGTL